MNVSLDFESGKCTVTHEEGDKKEKNESSLLYHVKLQLIKQGYDVIKKRMWKDGHLMDETQQYIRTRNPPKKKEDPNFCVFDNRWAVRFSHLDFNRLGVVTLEIVTDLW